MPLQYIIRSELKTDDQWCRYASTRPLFSYKTRRVISIVGLMSNLLCCDKLTTSGLPRSTLKYPSTSLTSQTDVSARRLFFHEILLVIFPRFSASCFPSRWCAPGDRVCHPCMVAQHHGVWMPLGGRLFGRLHKPVVKTVISWAPSDAVLRGIFLYLGLRWVERLFAPILLSDDRNAVVSLQKFIIPVQSTASIHRFATNLEAKLSHSLHSCDVLPRPNGSFRNLKHLPRMDPVELSMRPYWRYTKGVMSAPVAWSPRSK
ncbi:hypothetical protein A0H81_12379 [Grifola frondosa]|uniref:Uncharacterized protein n=1 Tax=Grifola frondosa TaxID=5627 RepID=A0A1C7LSL4_GRIFR|nr:hypothetical protein A0H81_12379 [Grifola frondosa]